VRCGVAATVTLREEFDNSGCTAVELAEFAARAIAFGLSGYAVRCVTAISGVQQGTQGTLLADPQALRHIRVLEVTGPAPEMR
jgi:hypothetical protein